MWTNHPNKRPFAKDNKAKQNKNCQTKQTPKHGKNRFSKGFSPTDATWRYRLIDPSTEQSFKWGASIKASCSLNVLEIFWFLFERLSKSPSWLRQLGVPLFLLNKNRDFTRFDWVLGVYYWLLSAFTGFQGSLLALKEILMVDLKLSS